MRGRPSNGLEFHSMVERIRKAIFPVGGLGTRFLPATKAMPKEMLPVVDKPLIQYAIEEANAAGIEEFIIVTGRGKTAIEDHLDHSRELEAVLAARGKTKELDAIKGWLPGPGRVSYVRQPEPLGLGHAVWCARHLIGSAPFAVMLPDDLILASTPCLAQMTEAYRETGGNLLAVQPVPRSHVSRYGVLKIGGRRQRLVEVEGLVEKPAPGRAPSTLAVIGRYILQPKVLALLDRQEPTAGGEIQLTDAIQRSIAEVPTHGFHFEGRRFDCGNTAGFVEANLAFALARPDLGPALQDVLRSYVDPYEPAAIDNARARPAAASHPAVPLDA
jgi:UTP--glucose-1-phosphate uridylyltransferase